MSTDFKIEGLAPMLYVFDMPCFVEVLPGYFRFFGGDVV
jgi:hypothetical protein